MTGLNNISNISSLPNFVYLQGWPCSSRELQPVRGFLSDLFNLPYKDFEMKIENKMIMKGAQSKIVHAITAALK
ncbi:MULTISPECIES: hypothetical protein [Burkholderia cepacia complex]|uniref:hypothetical protein n=1 Tax=Burkholderia cepacia complex TaxID=87882 RepID=UPI0012EDCD18|nr:MULTISPECIES: hypothetical protein [Burkholderia cepacia complex]MCA8088546.1 hypothetical protein [Burkholderia cenocepacia]